MVVERPGKTRCERLAAAEAIGSLLAERAEKEVCTERSSTTMQSVGSKICEVVDRQQIR